MPRPWLAVVLVTSACSAFGTVTSDGGSSPEPPDAGADASISDDAGTGPVDSDAGGGTFCERLRRTDPTVKLCVDFDDEATSPLFGATPALGQGGEVSWPDPSFIEGAGNDIVIGLSEGAGSRNAYYQFTVFDAETIPQQPVRVRLEVDVRVSELTLEYAALAGIHVSGSGCDLFAALAAEPRRFVAHTQASDTSSYPLPQDRHVHFMLVADAVTSSAELRVDGALLTKVPIEYGLGCDHVAVRIGAYSTRGDGLARARFDQLVVRVD